MSALQSAIQALIAGVPLSEHDAFGAVDHIMQGEANDAQIGAFLAALRIRGESVDVLTGAARAMRARVLPVVHERTLIVDTCGTGGDGAHTFNVSTAVAFVVAAAGVPVAKHGNRAVSSAVGSADVLEALGVAIDLAPERVARSLARTGFGFMFAPRYHAALRHAGPARKALGVRTMFNLLGPMTNPAGATHQLLGLFDGAKTRVVAEVLGRLGSRRALVVHGPGGLDELGLSGISQAVMLDRGELHDHTIDPRELGLDAAPIDALRGGDRAVNAALIRAVFAGERGPAADIVALNAGAALWVAEAAASLADGVAQARDALTRTAALLAAVVEETQATS